MDGYSFLNRVALVTGAGSGMGRATALMLAKREARVVVTDRDLSSAEATADLIRQAGGDCMSMAVDVTDRKAVRAAMDMTLERFGGLHLAVNNAGTPVAHASVKDTLDADWDLSVAVNLTGVRNCMLAELGLMERGGAIVNFSSVMGLHAAPNLSAYVASKHGVVGLTKAAAIDHAADGIRINAVCPGLIDTPWVANRFRNRTKGDLGVGCPMKRLGQPEEVAEAVIWLLSSRASFVTGAILSVDGGFSAT